MRLDNQAASDNIEDRRGGGRGRMIAGLGGGGGIIAVILMLLVNFLGGNPGAQQNAAGPNNVGFQRPDAVAPGAELTPEEKQQGEFCAKVLGSTETVWGDIFSANRLRYKEPKLVLFSGSTMSGCGGASANSGPFYCPADEKVYLDTMFFVQLERQFRAPGDFARAYVIAHEVGHHVQNLIGSTRDMDRKRRQLGPNSAEYNNLSVRLELQADFFAGVWAHHAQRNGSIQLDMGDLEEALGAARAIGDDTLQRNAGRAPRVETFTHGSSAQRIRWFRKGFESGDLAQGDTFDPNVRL